MYYFKNKKGLYEAVMHEVLEEIQKTVLEENKIHETPEQEFEGFNRTYAKFACSHPYLLLVGQFAYDTTITNLLKAVDKRPQSMLDQLDVDKADLGVRGRKDHR